jgi:hypothetical protein
LRDHGVRAAKVIMGRVEAVIFDLFQEFRCWCRGWGIAHATVVWVVVLCCLSHGRANPPRIRNKENATGIRATIGIILKWLMNR